MHTESLEIRPYGPSDAALVEQVVAHRNLAGSVDTPWRPHETVGRWSSWLSNGWDGDCPRPFAGLVRGQVVVSGEVTLPSYDNLHLANLGMRVSPSHRRRGFGSAMLAVLTESSRVAGRTVAVWGGWEGAATRGFAAHHGYQPKYVEVCRRQVLAETDWPAIERENALARARAHAYDLLHVSGPTPVDLLSAVAQMTAAINDAPNDDLDMEAELFTTERVSKYEESVLATDRLYRVIAQHRATGALAGHTVIAVDRARPGIGEQDDTSVVREHRGYRLGVLLKTDMLLWLRAVEPELAHIDTWNAKSNDSMIAVNELLGYRALGESVSYQATI
ncbi:MAG: GNAT family N-acetyltransferase [Nocardioides sp.]